jgi:uncharacterized protein
MYLTKKTNTNWFQRLFSFSLVQLIIELVIVAIFAEPAGILILNVHIPPILGECILVLGVVAAVFSAHNWIEHRPFAEMGLSRRHLMRDLLLGFLLGFFMLGTVIAIFALAGWYHMTATLTGSDAIVLILQELALFLLVALFEEGLFRSIIFRLVERSLGSWIAILISAIFFGFVHLINPQATIFGALAIALEGGILFAAAYMLTRSLWLAIGIHWSWNFFEGPFFGTTISGADSTKTFITSTTHGPEIWTGGSFGPEAGLVALFISLVVGTILFVLAVQRKQIIVPQWMQRVTAKATN